MPRKGTSPSYEENKKYHESWVQRNKEKVNFWKLRTYYKSKIENKDWAAIKYIFLDILVSDVT